MGIKSIFKRTPRRERIAALHDSTKFLELEKAVGRGDLEHVQDALAAGADPSYEIKFRYSGRPITIAVERNRVEILKALLETPGGQREAAGGTSPEGTVHLETGKPDSVWFSPSLLYFAINTGKHEIALALAQSSAVDVEYQGHLMNTKDLSHPDWRQFVPQVKSMMLLAQEKGMHDVAEIIARRQIDEIEQKRRAAEQKKRDEAAALRQQAEELLKKAEALSPMTAQTPRKNGKLNI